MNGAFLQCAGCRKILFAAEFEQNLRVCQHCGHHHRLSARERIELLFDPESFVETNTNLRSGNPLEFPEYQEKREAAEAKTGAFDSIVSGTALLNSQKVALAVSDFAFMGGSMGSVAGEKITRTFELALAEKCPVILVTTSGGARMQEGMLSLMQMAKTTAAAQRCREAGIPYLCVFTDPTMAGVLASYASVADIIIAEPKALVGLAGARVSKQAGVSKIPDDFQTSEYVHHHGLVDKIVHRRDLRNTLVTLVGMVGAHLNKGAA